MSELWKAAQKAWREAQEHETLTERLALCYASSAMMHLALSVPGGGTESLWTLSDAVDEAYSRKLADDGISVPDSLSTRLARAQASLRAALVRAETAETRAETAETRAETAEEALRQARTSGMLPE